MNLTNNLSQDLKANMAVQEAYVKHVLRHLLERHPKAVQRVTDKHNDSNRPADLQRYIGQPFSHLTYTQALEALKTAHEHNTDRPAPPKWGEDLRHEHEVYLANEVRWGGARRCWDGAATSTHGLTRGFF